MIQDIKIWNPNVNNGEPFWVTIAHESEEEELKEIDDDIYFYVDSDNVYEAGDLIQLDEVFAVLGVE
jgi:ABC-type Fe3+-hydroxamate transport system substrate-binding protein